MATPVMLDAIDPTIAPESNFPSTAMFRIPLRSETIPASAPMPTGMAKLSVLVKNTVRFAVVPSKSRAKRAMTKAGAMIPIEARHANFAPRRSWSRVIAIKPTETIPHRSATGTEKNTCSPPIESLQNAKLPSTPNEPEVMNTETAAKIANSPARIRAATCCWCASALSPAFWGATSVGVELADSFTRPFEDFFVRDTSPPPLISSPTLNAGQMGS